MGLFKRMSDIISANLNDMAESYEDPEKMLKQAVYEMESSIDEARRNVARSMASEKMLAKELAENERQTSQWQSRAEAAVASGDDQLARKALSRKQEFEKLVAALTDQSAAATEASTTLRRQLDGMQAKLADARRRLGTLTARKKAADVRAKVALGTIDPQLNADAFAKFDRMREKVEMAEAEADALRELAGDNGHRHASAVEVNDVDLEVDAELRELKLKLKK
ncbi:MAG TPA: PspA/IM30 family protein [Pirellulales bacterium]|jgi:phage shock protein A|nr:PspA/IM30 family protein [Pirellulales bacterium]